MKHSLVIIVIAGATGVGIGLSANRLPRFSAPASAQNGPSQTRLELDNDAMQVLRIRLAPHEKTGMHDVSARLVVWLTDARLRDTNGDGITNDYQPRAGEIEWVPVRRHAGENLSDSPIEFLAIIPKSGAAAVPQTGHHPAQH